MIKSSQGTNNNIYRIVKVLSNQDYLVVDTTSTYFILCQEVINSECAKISKTSNKIKRNEHVLEHKQRIMINSINYLVFEVGTPQIIWVKDIAKKQLESSSFIKVFIRETIFNILSVILWNPQQALLLLHINNFWFVSDVLCLLAMPRTHKDTSLKRTEKKRSFSQQTSSISSILDKQLNVIKKTGEIVWEILEKEPFKRKASKNTELWIIQKMIKKQITYEELKIQIDNPNQTLFSTNLKRFVRLSPLKDQSSKRKYTEPISLAMSRAKSKRTSLNALNESRYQFKNSFSPQLFNRKVNVKSSISFTQVNNAQNSEKKHHSNEKQKQEQKQNLFVTPKKHSFGRPNLNTNDRNKYLNWLQMHKYNSSSIRKDCPKSNQNNEESNKKDENSLNEDKELKARLLSKIQKYRASRYCRSVQTQTSQSFQKENSRSQDIKNSFDQKEQKETIHEQKIQNQIILQPIAPAQTTFQRDEEINKQQIVEIKEEKSTSKQNQKLSKQMSSSFWKEQIPVIEHEDIQQIDFKKIQLKKQDETSQSKKKEPTVTPSIPLSTPKQKQKKARSDLKQLQFEDISDIQVISFNPNHRKTNSSETQNSNKIENNTITKTQMPQQTKKQQESFVKQKSSLNYNDKVLLENILEQVKEFINMINILADISVTCVKLKQKLSRYKWRTSIYFIYQRFFHERIDLLTNLKKGQLKNFVRKKHNVQEKATKLWSECSARIQIIAQVERQNIKIQDTYQRLAKKTLEECELQPNIQKFIKKRNLILSSNKNNIRSFLSKYAVAFIINEFDNALQKQKNSEEQLNYLTKSLFGLMILAELDNKETKKKLSLNEYYKKQTSLRQHCALVEHIYNLYYPDEQTVFK